MESIKRLPECGLHLQTSRSDFSTDLFLWLVLFFLLFHITSVYSVYILLKILQRKSQQDTSPGTERAQEGQSLAWKTGGLLPGRQEAFFGLKF